MIRLLFLTHTLEWLVVSFLVDELASVSISFDPVVSFWIVRLRSISDSTLTVPVSLWRICGHGRFLLPFAKSFDLSTFYCILRGALKPLMSNS
jgi:hypothetical protein